MPALIHLRQVLIALLLCSLSWAVSAWSVDRMAPRIDVLPESFGTADPQAVLRGEFDAAFEPFAHDKAPGFGSPLWLRLTLPTDWATAGEWILELRSPFVNRFDLYAPQELSGFKRATAGNMVEPTANVVPFQFPAFRLTLPPYAGPVYVRMDTLTTRSMNAYFWRPAAFEAYARNSYLIQGVLFGAFFGLGLLYVLVGTFSRNANYVVYACYVMGMVLIHGLAQGLLGPLPRPLYNSVLGLGACLAIGLNAELLRIANPQRHYPQLTRTYRWVCWGLAGGLSPLAAAGFFNIVSPIGQVIYLGQAVVGCVVGAVLWWRGEPASRSFFLGFLVMHIVLLGFVFQNLGLIPDLSWTRLAMVGAAFAHFAMMSVAMAERLRRLAQQRLAAQQTLVASLQESEQQLEQRVQDRTTALRREMRLRQAADAELRAANLRTEQALTLERQANQRQRDFFLMVSHDFRTPLSVLAATVGGPATPGTVSPARHARARRAVAQLEALVDKSLAADNFDRLEPAFHIVDVALAPLIDEVVQRTQDLEDAPPIATSVRADCTVRGDPLWLRILLTNLMHNIVRHTPVGTRVLVRSVQRDDTVEISLEDDGPGLPAEHLDDIGRRRQRPAQADRPSSGVGLYVVREIVDRHDGEIRFDASPLGGLRVTLFLPAGARRADQHAA